MNILILVIGALLLLKGLQAHLASFNIPTFITMITDWIPTFNLPAFAFTIAGALLIYLSLRR